MKKFIILIMLVFMPHLMFSQTGWSRYHTGVSFSPYSILFLDSLNGFLLYGNTVFFSSNGGMNWSQRSTQLTGTCFSIARTPSGNIFVCGYYYNSFEYGFIGKSSNMGISWTETQIFDNYFNDIYFVNNNTGYCVGKYGVIVKTTNAGGQWFNIGGLEEYSQLLNRVCFTGIDTGYIGNEVGRIFKTVNGGYNWTSYPAYPLTHINSLVFPSSDTGYCSGYLQVGAGYKSNCYRTTNKGYNWTCIDTATYVIFDIFFTSARTGYHVGQYGQIEKTTNCGASWTIQNSTVGTDLKSIYFINTNTGFIGGAYDVALKTMTGGEYVESVSNIYLPADFKLLQNYPNPFNPQTKIKFAVSKTSLTKLAIYDLLGREVATLVNEELKPGTYEADWDGSNYSSGVYFYKIISEGFVVTKKMVLMK